MMLALKSIKNFETVIGREGATISFGPGIREGSEVCRAGIGSLYCEEQEMVRDTGLI